MSKGYWIWNCNWHERRLIRTILNRTLKLTLNTNGLKLGRTWMTKDYDTYKYEYKWNKREALGLPNPKSKSNPIRPVAPNVWWYDQRHPGLEWVFTIVIVDMIIFMFIHIYIHYDFIYLSSTPSLLNLVGFRYSFPHWTRVLLTLFFSG